MKKLIGLLAVFVFANMARANMVTIYSENSWDLPQADYTIEAILARNGINYADFTQVDIETWVTQTARCVIVDEIAGNKDINAFGWYNVSKNGSKPILNQIFSGLANAGDSKTVDFSTNESAEVGFYLDPDDNPLNGKDIFYSQPGLNNGVGQLAVFQKNTEKNKYIFAWEDLSMKNGSSNVNPSKSAYSSTTKTDGDFNDFIVQVTTVPEPAILDLFVLSSISFPFLLLLFRKRC